jgi:hypothetical protein
VVEHLIATYHTRIATDAAPPIFTFSKIMTDWQEPNDDKKDDDDDEYQY